MFEFGGCKKWKKKDTGKNSKKVASRSPLSYNANGDACPRITMPAWPFGAVFQGGGEVKLHLLAFKFALVLTAFTLACSRRSDSGEKRFFARFSQFASFPTI